MGIIEGDAFLLSSCFAMRSPSLSGGWDQSGRSLPQGVFGTLAASELGCESAFNESTWIISHDASASTVKLLDFGCAEELSPRSLACDRIRLGYNK